MLDKTASSFDSCMSLSWSNICRPFSLNASIMLYISTRFTGKQIICEITRSTIYGLISERGLFGIFSLSRQANKATRAGSPKQHVPITVGSYCLGMLILVREENQSTVPWEKPSKHRRDKLREFNSLEIAHQTWFQLWEAQCAAFTFF